MFILHTVLWWKSISLAKLAREFNNNEIMMMNLIRTSTSLIILILMFTCQSSAKIDPKTLVEAWLFDGNASD